MCLALPGQIVEMIDDPNRIAKVDVADVCRDVSVGPLAGDALRRVC